MNARTQLKETDYKLKYEKLLTAYTTLERVYEITKQRLDLELYKKYMRSSEKEALDKSQQLLFEIEISKEELEKEEKEVVTVTAHKRVKQGRKPINKNIPREEIIIDIPEEEKHCACGCELSRIGEESSERLQIIPERIFVERTIRPKYACKACEGSGDEDRPAVRVAPAPLTLIPGSIATENVLAHIFANKFIDHLPYYRQEARFKRIGVSISRQNMSNWQLQVHKKLLPLFTLLKAHIKKGKVIQMDETTVQVLGEEDKNNSRLSYMWLARGGPPDKPAIYFEYQRSRASEHIHDFLVDFSGYLQTDGYRGYDTALKKHPDIIHVGCFAHARRKFFDASKVTKRIGSAEEAMKYIRNLYAIESKLRKQGLSDNEFIAERKKLSLPILEKFKTWLDKKEEHVPASLPVGKAVHYTLGQWEKLIAYLNCADLTPDNNACENAIRPFVIGRKNWLFSGSPEGAKSSSLLYSLIETAKQNKLNPQEYLTHVFTKVPHCKTQDDWEALLPWNATI